MRYVLGAIGVIILVILAIALFVGRSPSPNNASQAGKKKVSLTDYIKPGTEVRYTTDGPVNAKEKHRVIQITVSPTERKVDIFTGYKFEVERSKQLNNDEAAYNSFMRALSNSGFVNQATRQAPKDETGICPLGSRYIYELLEGSSVKVKLWSASCAANLGTFAGSAGVVRQLFQAQIPDYNKFVQGVGL